MFDLKEETRMGRPSRVRRDSRSGAIVIEGVKFLGNESVNVNADGTRNAYPIETRRRALPLYEGADVYAGHRAPGSKLERGYHEKLGRLRNVRAEADGSYGTLVLNPKHPLAEQIAWDAEHSPDSLGLSHDAKGGGARVQGKRRVIESVIAVNSVDVVTRGATVASLFESRRPAPTHARPTGPRTADEFVDRLDGQRPAPSKAALDAFLRRLGA